MKYPALFVICFFTAVAAFSQTESARIGSIKQLKTAQEHLSGMLINAQEAERSRPPLVEWI
jgi:hypothetical protein